jgi:hypothetical protein
MRIGMGFIISPQNIEILGIEKTGSGLIWEAKKQQQR